MTDNLAIKAGTVNIGDKLVSRIGLGTNRITNNDLSHHILREAVSFGVNFIDTAYRYSGGESETSIGNTFSPYSDSIVVATKGGLDINGPNGRPEVLRSQLETSLKRLKTDCIDLYQLHRVDPSVPIEDSIGEIKRFQEEGKIRFIGLSEVDIDQLKLAQSIADIVSVQNEYNVIVRQHESLVDYCTDKSIVFIPWFPLGGLSGGLEKVEHKLQALATKYSISAQSLAMAWLLKRSPMILPIPGTLSLDHLKDNLLSSEIELSEEDYQDLLDNY